VVPGRAAALCQPESGALQPDVGSACSDIIIEKASSEDRRGAQPPNTAGGNTTRGETAHGGTPPANKPVPQGSTATVVEINLKTFSFPPCCLNKLNHRSTNTGLGSTTSAPRGGDIKDKEREVRAGRSQALFSSWRPRRHRACQRRVKGALCA